MDTDTRTTIDTRDDAVIRLWADRFKVSIDELWLAIKQVGNDAERLRRYLGA